MKCLIKITRIVALLLFAMGLSLGVSAYAASTATAVAQIENGSIVNIRLLCFGSGYSEKPEISLVGGGGTNGRVRVQGLYNGELSGVDIVNGGTGYTEPPKVIIQSPYANTLKTPAKVAGVLCLICAVVAVGYFVKKSKSVGNVASKDLGISKNVVYAIVFCVVVGFGVYSCKVLRSASPNNETRDNLGGGGSSSGSKSISMSDVAGNWENRSDMIEISLRSSGACTFSYGHNNASKGSWRLSGNTVVVNPGDGGSSLSFVYDNGKLVAPNGHYLTPR